MSNEKKIFLIGPGLIGADLLELLLDDGYEVTTMVRREEHAAQIKNLDLTSKSLWAHWMIKT